MAGQTLYSIESGKAPLPRADRAIALAEALSEALGEPVTVEDLFRPARTPAASHKARKPRAGSGAPKPGSMRNRKARM